GVDAGRLHAGRESCFRGVDLFRTLGLGWLGVALCNSLVHVEVGVDARLELGERGGVGIHSRISARFLLALRARRVCRARPLSGPGRSTAGTYRREDKPLTDAHVVPPRRGNVWATSFTPRAATRRANSSVSGARRASKLARCT